MVAAVLVRQRRFDGGFGLFCQFFRLIQHFSHRIHGSLVDDEMDQQVFILDLSFNPEITDELMVIYFDLNKEIFCITHES